MRQFGHNRTVAKPLILIGGAFAAGIVFSSGFSPRGCPVLSLIALLALFAVAVLKRPAAFLRRPSSSA